MIGLQQNQREKDIRNRVFKVAEDYGLKIEEELDKVSVKYLGTYVNAQTSKEGPNLRIDFDSTNFFNMSEKRQRRTILHELIHIKQFNNSLSDWAKEMFNASDQLADKLDGTIWEDVKSVEGETELILSNLFPEQESSYPYAMSTKEKEFEDLGIGSEIEKQLELEEDEIMEQYREIEDTWEKENLYIEEGEFKGENYTVAVLGSDNPEKEAKDYIIDKFDYGPVEPAYSSDTLSSSTFG